MLIYETSLKGILYIILAHNHSFHFLTLTPPPPPNCHPAFSLLFFFFFNDLYQLFCINTIRAEPLLSLVAPEFACVRLQVRADHGG